jgi:broad specificity phosphatase PhoE
MAEPPTRVLVVRHGQSTWNARGKWQGHADPPLSMLGQAQATAAATAIGAVDAIVSSDLVRAHQTAAHIADAIGRGPVLIDERLREIDAGEWTGLTRVEIEQQWPGYLDAHRRPPRFEHWERVAERAGAALVELGRRWSGGAAVLAVSHSGVIRCLERALDVHDPIVPNLGGRWFDVAGSNLVAGERVLLIDPNAVEVTMPGSL